MPSPSARDAARRHSLLKIGRELLPFERAPIAAWESEMISPLRPQADAERARASSPAKAARSSSTLLCSGTSHFQRKVSFQRGRGS